MIFDPGLTSTEKVALIAIAFYDWGDGRGGFPSNATLIKACGLKSDGPDKGESAMRNVLKGLKDRGYIRVEKVARSPSNRTGRVIHLLPRAAEDPAPPGYGYAGEPGYGYAGGPGMDTRVAPGIQTRGIDSDQTDPETNPRPERVVVESASRLPGEEQPRREGNGATSALRPPWGIFVPGMLPPRIGPIEKPEDERWFAVHDDPTAPNGLRLVYFDDTPVAPAPAAPARDPAPADRPIAPADRPNVSATLADLEGDARKKFAGSDQESVLACLLGWLEDLTDPEGHAIPVDAASSLIREAFDHRRKAIGPVARYLDGILRNKAKEFRGSGGSAGRPTVRRLPPQPNLPDPDRAAAEKVAKAEEAREAAAREAADGARWDALPAEVRAGIESNVRTSPAVYPGAKYTYVKALCIQEMNTQFEFV